MFQFGAGLLHLNPITTLGNPATNPTPAQVLTVQDVSVDITQELKELFGQNKFPEDIAPGTMKVSGKFTTGRIDIAMLNQVFFADTAVTGMTSVIPNESGTIPGTPFQVTVAAAATFVTDLGVKFKATGQSLVRVASSPITGQYSVSAGVYTFAAADTTKVVLISYAATTTSGATTQINNQLMGYGPVFELYLSEPYNAITVTSIPRNNGLKLFAVRLSKLNRALKRDDYEKPELDFSAFANVAGQVGELYQIAV